MPSAYIGTSGWYYKGWAGTFYPADLPPSQWLPFYAQRFPTVEINATFYRLPFENMVSGWRNRAPEGFLFAVKGSRRITHLKKLVGVDEELDRFFDRLAPLEARFGPVLWQLPPGLHKDVRRLDRFLAKLPARYRHAVEFRHPSWISEDAFETLRSHAAAAVWISSRAMPMDFAATADFVYLRFHGLSGGYAHDYAEAELRPWADGLRRAVEEGRNAFVYFNNDADARAPKNAQDLSRLLGDDICAPALSAG